MTLRDYQTRALSAVREGLAAKRSTVLVCPTGGGKTIMGASAAAGHLKRNDGHSVLWLAHRRELVDQAVRTIRELSGESVRTIVAGQSSGEGRVTVASIDTVRNWADLPPATLVVIDECHHARAATWEALLARFATAYRLGLTATPQRHDGRGLGDVFAHLHTACTVRQLTDAGHLVPCRVYSPPEQQDGLAALPVDAYNRFGEWRSAVTFCTTVDQAKRHVDEFNAAKIPAALIDGTMRADIRADILGRFASGEIGVLCNVAVLTEGWDCPRASVAILARGCSHAGLYLQIVGRVLRPYKDKHEARVIDLRGVVFQHGLPDADREFTLSDDPIKAKTDSDAIAQCKACGAVYEWQPRCPMCGFQSPPQVRKVKLSPAELKERFAKDDENERLRYKQKLEAEAKEKGYRYGWVAHRYAAKYG